MSLWVLTGPLSTQAICNVSLSLLSSPGFPVSLSPGKQERNWCLLMSKTMGRGAYWYPRSWTSSDVRNYPSTPQTCKGCRILPCNSWVDANTWIFMHIQYLHSSLFLQGGTSMPQVASGTMNDRWQWGEGLSAFAICQSWELHKHRASCTCRQDAL